MPSMPSAAPDFLPGAASWQPHLALGITGHRATNPSFSAHARAIEAALERLFARIDAITAALPGPRGALRLHSLLVDGTDQVAARLGLARGWELVVPLPFGAALNLAINAHPGAPEDAAALCRGGAAADPAVEARAAAIRAITARAHLFELADHLFVLGNLQRREFAAIGRTGRGDQDVAVRRFGRGRVFRSKRRVDEEERGTRKACREQGTMAVHWKS